MTVGLVAVLAAAGCERAGPGAASPPTTAPIPSTSAPVPATSSPAATPPATQAPAPTVIPLSAFLKLPKDMTYGESRLRADVDEALPRLCGDEFASRGATAASAAVKTVHGLPRDPPGTVPSGVLYQTIRTYPGDGASVFMRRLRADLAACSSFTDEGNSFRVRTAPLRGVGDEALTIDLVQPARNLPGDLVGGFQTNRAAVIRVGDTVTILWDAEYERSNSKPAVVADFARRAVATIHAWRR
ncbi:hypothetical protein Ais01nite_14660 [Asanoa ishikariensis]|uniref:PknH-like extracellular domain-containing protein n=1 Tax=Asanoa ishikariensis TaxID=137265 RepID=A0A1H3UK63_9ACTN|nr:hypothetical protein Ais01nite_14660 [Asanoa ishikariensis]SDZ62225.1 hypothetical protein SAMN05421684_7407 [Asanoa ishikariensis]